MAIYEDIEIQQGSYFRYSANITSSDGSAYDFANHTLAAVMKKNYASTTVAATFTVETTATTGEITMVLLASQTSDIKSGRYVFDIVMKTPDSQTHRIVEGIVTLSPAVTTIS